MTLTMDMGRALLVLHGEERSLDMERRLAKAVQRFRRTDGLHAHFSHFSSSTSPLPLPHPTSENRSFRDWSK